QVEADGIRVSAQQPEPARLVLDLWPAADRKIASVRAQVGPVETAAATIQGYPAGNQTTAVLFVVDTSDPTRRKAEVRQAAGHITEVLDKAGDHTRFGLARLDAKLEVLAPVGTAADELRSAVNGLKAQGATTELFRSTLSAIEVLRTTDATRRAMIVFSDGRHEDTAYSHEDVVAAARIAAVPVYAIGYSRTRDGTRWFQSLIRMSEETGGAFIAADRKLALPKDFVARLQGALDRGGRASIDLAAVTAAGIGGPQTAKITIGIDGGEPVTLSLPVTLPAIGFVARVTAAANRPYLIAGGAVLVILLLLAVVLALRRSQRARTRRATEAVAAVPYAFLEFFDDSETRFPVGDKAVRLGRNDDNDVRLTNTSVSGYHAEIQRRRDGTFIVTDLDSLNGVAINDETVDTGRLQDGDVVDLGEVRFRFRVNPDRPAPGASEADR
ncbi:MAG: FHA domain-containing protein, partial [Alphaproteobacteria bacterium]|nr:FHA domain-containing protein [Alphaproteobacteria bacterium]